MSIYFADKLTTVSTCVVTTIGMYDYLWIGGSYSFSANLVKSG